MNDIAVAGIPLLMFFPIKPRSVHVPPVLQGAPGIPACGCTTTLYTHGDPVSGIQNFYKNH
jgi:hypothetical protein